MRAGFGFNPARMIALEDEFQAELDIPRVARACDCPEGSVDVLAIRSRCEGSVRNSQIDVVQEVECFSPELQVDSFLNPSVLNC